MQRLMYDKMVHKLHGSDKMLDTRHANFVLKSAIQREALSECKIWHICSTDVRNERGARDH